MKNWDNALLSHMCIQQMMQKQIAIANATSFSMVISIGTIPPKVCDRYFPAASSWALSNDLIVLPAYNSIDSVAVPKPELGNEVRRGSGGYRPREPSAPVGYKSNMA